METKTLKEKFAVWDEEYKNRNMFEKAYDFVRWTIPRVVDDWKYEIKWAWQRVFNGYDDRYWWSHYHEHTTMTLSALKKFREKHYGSPSSFFEPGLSNEDGHALWDDVLDKIIAGFQASHDIEDTHILNSDGEYDMKATNKEVKRLMKIRDIGLLLYVKYYSSLWD